MLNTLYKLGLKYGTDKSENGYMVIYQLYFYKIRQTCKRILEIGIQNGYSLKVWEEYFPNAKIVGIDIDDKKQFDTKRTRTIKGNQSDRNFLDTLPMFDIIIDDGGHTMEQQQISLGCLFKKVNKGGLYIVEDLGTSLMPFEAYGGNANNIDTTLSVLEDFKKTGILDSKYVMESEKLFIETNCSSLEIYGDYEGKLGNYNPDNLGGIAGILKRDYA